MQSTMTNTVPPLEQLKPLSEFAERIGMDPATIYRWATTGLKSGLRLPAWQLNQWCTTQAHFDAFVAARTQATIAAATTNPVVQPIPTSIKKRAAVAAAKLKAKGMKRHAASK